MLDAIMLIRGGEKMKKSVYSLVLSDDVVAAVDELAYKMNTSRSNLINQILAEHVSFKTPESIMKDIFNCMRAMMDNHFQIQGQASDAMLSIRSPLRYKPTIRYRVELKKEIDNDVFGFLSVSFRTQSTQLLAMLEGFFKLWYKLENYYIGKYFSEGVEYVYSDGKFIRKLKFSKNIDKSQPESVGRAIGEYVRLIDTQLKLYFAGTDEPELTAGKMERLLLDRLNSGMAVI